MRAVVSDWITKPRYFIGRQDLLNGITQILSNPLQTRAVVIHGGPGMGKTTIVSEYATKVHATFYTHVLWISLTTETSFSDSILRSCELLGIQVEGDTEKVKNLVFNWLSTHNGYLLILDNADEHILVENCLKGLRRISGHVLITTRNSVIDQHIALGMSYSDIFHRKIDVWTDELSRQYINARFPDLEYSEYESVALKRILELMGGYPLVIEQMCSYISFVQSCNFADYLEKLTSGSDENIWKFEPLIGVSNYQRTLDSTIEIALEYFKNNGKTFCCILLGGIAAIGTKDIPITTYLQTYLQHAGFKNTPIQTAISPIVEMSLITINSNKRTVSTHLAIRDAIRRRLGFAKTNPENTLRRKPAFSSDQIDFTWLAIYAMKELIPKSHNGTYDAKSVSTGPQLLPHVSELVAVSKTPNPTLAKICDVAGDFADYISSFNIGRSLFLNAIQMNTEINKGSRVCESIAHSITGLANIEKKRGDFDEAKKLFTECLEIYFKVHGTRMHTSVAATLNNLGYIARKQKRFDEAKKLYAESLDIYKTTDPTKPQAVVANAFDNLGSIAYYEEDYDEAFRLYSECLKIKEQIYGNRRHTRLAPSINHLGNIANRLKKYDEAVTLYTESLEIYEEAFGTRQHPYIANIIGNLGTIEKSRGRNEESVRFYKECLAISEKAYGTRNHSDIAKTLSNLGQVYEKMGNREEAVVNYKESLKIYKIVFGEDYPSYIKVQNALQSFVV
ncbi:hypothetical protein HK098_003474 [Nowakowskiella sp. JEL0407]|nr:hypothetical protein HK098_003474 [Nowakowskiella sp. JEL0407]